MAICSFCLNALSSTSKASWPNSLKQKGIKNQHNMDQSKLRVTAETRLLRIVWQVGTPSPIFLIALSVHPVKNNLGCKPNYLVLITLFRVILFCHFLFLFLISLSDQNGTYKVLCICSNQQFHHHCEQALQPVAEVSSFGLI